MLIDAYAAKPVLNNCMGGLSGAALKPIALRCVAEIASRISLPIIGTGGVTQGLDATLVGVGSAIWHAGPDVMSSISAEVQNFMDAEGYHSLEEMRGRAIR